jgi:hypothetical protein
MNPLTDPHGAAGDPPTGGLRAPHETRAVNLSHTMKTQTLPTYTVGSVTFMPYEKFGIRVQPAPTAPDLAKLYDRAAYQIGKLVYALKLCAPLTKRAQQARSEAFDAVMEDMKS